VIDPAALQIVLNVLTGWLDRREREAVAYLIEENRLLRRQLGGRRLHLTDDDRRRLAVRAYRLGRAALRETATIATPDTLLRWHRQLIARKWTYAVKSRPRGVLIEIRQLVLRMATENPTWGYTRIQGALTNVGHHVGRSTIRRILKAAGLPPVPERPTSWQTFVNAGGSIAGADFFTTDVWTWRAWLRSTRSSSSTCAPNANADAERFVRSIKEECLDRLIPLGERHFRTAMAEYVEHYHRERNHQGLENRLISGQPPIVITSRVRRRPRLGGLLNFYERAA
jgi:integrase-like protein/helix-turn-helix protein